MSKLIISKKDLTTQLVYQYVALNVEDNKGLNVEVEDTESSKLTLENGTVVEGSNSIQSFLTSTYDEKLVGTAEEPQVQADVQQWLTATSTATEVSEFAKNLNSHLSGKSYLAANRLTLADVVAYSKLRDHLKEIGTDGQKSLLNAVRWFNQVQNQLDGTKVFNKLSIEAISLDLDALNLGGKKKKEKKAAAPAAKAAPVQIVPSMIDLRVGKIVEVAKHEAADSLYVEQIELGEEAPRTVVSGLVNHFSLEEMKDRFVVLVCNLKPASMRGVKSFAMVLCGTSSEGKVEFVTPPEGSQPGDRVYFEGFEGQEPESVLNPKKKIWETIQPTLHTDGDRIAGWTDPESKKFHQLRTHLGLCLTPTAINSTLK